MGGKQSHPQFMISGALFPGLPTVDRVTASLLKVVGGTPSFVLQLLVQSSWEEGQSSRSTVVPGL